MKPLVGLVSICLGYIRDVRVQLQCVLTRSGQNGLVFNLDIEGVETPELVRWIDDLHK